MRRTIVILFSVVALSVAACSAGPSPTVSSDQQVSGDRQTTADGSPGEDPDTEAGSEARGGAAEAIEEGQETAERIDSADAARAAGTFGVVKPVKHSGTPGWSGEQPLNLKTNDWEPAVAADPRKPFVYLATTRYDAPKLCPKHCPSPYIALTRSKDGGETWGPQVPLCRCRGASGQYDPTLEVVPNTGAVYSVMLNADGANAFSASFLKSTDHGKTWTKPVHVYGDVKWTDKPEITMSPSGKNVYVSWNGPSGGDLYVGISHNYGRSWTQQRLTKSKRYYYAYDAETLANGTVVFSESSFLYGDHGTLHGRVRHHAIISRNRGKTWKNVIVGRVPIGEACVSKGCGSDFYTGQTSVTSDPRGHLVFAYEGPTVDKGPQRVVVRTSNDKGRTWGHRKILSIKGRNATGPRLASDGVGDARIWYMQTAAGSPTAWNVWYRSTSNGGKTWSSPVRLSDASTGAGYKSARGFDEIYGDYGEIAVTSEGRTIAAWGEGFSYNGPGGTWFALQN